ncbi:MULTISPECIES: GNAT family N-acetyltransferase [unclassified Streptomyces]|uniref:GNAT family N-acetyltransferase n=1 Tax=unclassified Streptomyces TaxID=2593676 RepID=UPI0036516D79
MITLAPRTAPRSVRAALPDVFPVRSARSADAAALAALSQPFVRSGALRARSLSLYVADAADFLVVDAPDGTLLGCLGLSVHPAGAGTGRGASGVLYNFCVAPGSQGRGLGAGLLTAALVRANSRSLTALFTATTGSGEPFRRHGFAPAHVAAAPPTWVDSLSPDRNSRILTRSL